MPRLPTNLSQGLHGTGLSDLERRRKGQSSLMGFIPVTLSSSSCAISGWVKFTTGGIKMVKTHKVLVKIKNNSGLDMIYVDKWYRCGRSDQDWPKPFLMVTIKKFSAMKPTTIGSFLRVLAM